MLPSANRMRRRDEFGVAVRRGQRAGRPTLVLHLLTRPDAPDDEPLVGFVVARSVGNAVVRNRVRRRLRHLMRDHVHRLPRGSLLVVRANPAAAEARADDLAADLDSALERVRRRPARPTSKGRR
ncbi:ribonuclease P protein component [Actinomadura rayongensis]|uniref:Ribonuclease P protein component n=1 Tax=Actinomadura rayongensis TaxID=1429076 RepID=A0A6I4W432_9ACTN|nr:ribonuclease P protein component [Actinomadura rayongensis]MXQ65429.1 ribonuclease P protein component [Actinomadura rayongensis]